MTTLEAISVAWRDRPFDGRFHRAVIPFAGKPPTIADAVAQVQGLPPGFQQVGEVRLNGVLIPREWWQYIRPRSDRDSAITLHMPLKSGGGGGGGSTDSGKKSKSTLATVATIGVLLAATALTAGAAAPLLGAGFGASTLGAALLGASVGIGGALIVASLFPPPTLATNTAQQTAPGVAQGPASLSGNALSPGAAIPRVIGTMRVFPPVVSPQLIELIAGTEYAEIVFGLSGPHDLESIWCDGVDIGQLAEVSLEVQEGFGPIQSLVTRQGFTATPNVTLSQQKLSPLLTSEVFLDASLPVSLAVPQWHQFTTGVGPDEVWINLDFTGGLFASGGGLLDIPFRIQIRPTGTNTWISLPELHYQRKPSNTSDFQTEIRLKWTKPPPVLINPVDLTAASGWILAYIVTPGSAYTPTDAGWTANSYFSNGGGGSNILIYTDTATTNVINTELGPDRANIYLDPAVFPPGQYDVQIKRGCAYANQQFQQGTYVYPIGGIGNTTIDFFSYVYDATNGGNRIPVIASGITSDVTITRVASVWNENPIQSSDFATISMKVHNRSVQNVSVLASGFVYDWDGTGWNTLTTTSNPAPHFRDVLGGLLGSSALPAILIDDAGLVAWRTACNSSGYECNAVVEGKTYVDVLTLIASTGYARARSSETWGVIRDYDRSAEAPVQIFTPRNMDNFVWNKAFAKMPSGFRVTYYNKLLNYTQDDTIVFADDVNQDADNLESVSYDGLVTLPEVQQRAAYDLQQAVSRFTFYSGTVDLESLVCQRGDLVGVQFDTLDTKAGYARIRSVTDAGGLVTGLKFEGTVTIDTEATVFANANLFTASSIFNLGSQTGIAIRLKAGNGILLKEITALVDDEVDTVTFVTPFADPGTSVLDGDCLCAIGPLGSEYRRMLVQGIVPKDDMTASITFVDEAPELWPARFGIFGGAFFATEPDGNLLVPDAA